MNVNFFQLSIILLFFGSLLSISRATASPVDSLTARRAAINFHNWKTGRPAEETTVQLSYKQMFAENTSAEVCALFVFNIGSHFVMVSADTRVIPVLGYSFESSFNPDNIPEAMQDLLEDYAAEIKSVVSELSDEESEETISKWNRLLSGEMPMMTTTSSVAPLLHTLWDQNNPYNSMCPADANGPGGHVYAGCVACALAQILRYWEYPTTGIGSHSYICDFPDLGYGSYGMQSVNFGATTYNYNLMPNTLNGASQAQIDEVAKLMYHCGVAVEMMYDNDGSGAYDSKALTALNAYFGYNGVQSKSRSNYSSDVAWISLLKGELNNLRPIYYSGQGSGGHSFVCDGYDDQDFFHFNWGWSGSYNGFFSLSNMNPGSYAFNNSHLAIIGIDAGNPMLHLNAGELAFLTEAGTISEIKSVSVLGASLPDSITATVTGNFRISTDSVNFYTSRSLANSGGMLYVRHYPTGTGGTDHGYIYLSSGNTTDTVSLTGNIYNINTTCDPPQNLSFSTQDLQHIDLHWEAPQFVSDTHILSWSSGDVHSTYGYTSNDYQISMMQRFTETDLAEYHNLTLTAIRFYADADATMYKAVVYMGGSYHGAYDPGTMVLSQDISLSSLTMNAWNTIQLNTPVVIDAAQELWLGIYVEALAGTYAMPVSLDEAPMKGSIRGYHSSGSISWGEMSPDQAYCVMGIVENVQTLTNYQISRDGTVIGTTTATSYQDYVTTTGTYQYVVTANWNNGCSASTQRTFTNITQIIVTPEVLDFYANHGYGTLVKSVVVDGCGLSSDIQATVSGNFLISTNGNTYSSSLGLPSSGGTLFVKYSPSPSSNEFESGLVTLTSGNISTTVALSGQQTSECYPPQNLVATLTANTVDLNWNQPAAQLIQQQSLTWYQSSGLMNYGSNISSTQRYLVHRFATNDLTPYHGKLLTAVSFVASSEATIYRIVVYKGGSAGSYYLSSGTQVVNQMVNVDSLTAGTWNTIVLNTPVTIDAGQELWYGIYLEAPVGSHPIPMGTPYVAKKGLIFKSSNESDNNWREYLTSDYCFSLKATIEDAPISLIHYQIDRNESPVGQTDSTAYHDFLIYNGEYGYTVWAVWDNGCRAYVRDNITVTGLCDPTGTSATAEECEQYVWHDSLYTESGVYTFGYTLSDGCPAMDTLYLTVNHGTHNVETVNACENHEWHGTSYSSSGVYTHSYTNASGCESADTLYLTVNPTYMITVYDTAFREHNYTFNEFNIVPHEIGTYTYDFQYTSAEGCDSSIHLILTILNNDGIPANEQPSVEIYPNPAHTLLNIKGEDMRKIMIYNTDGQLIYSKEDNINNPQQVDVTRYASDQYLVKILLDNKQSVTRRVVVNHK